MNVIKRAKQALMVLGLAFVPYAYFLRNAVPARCQHSFYESGYRDGQIAAEHGGLAAIAVDGSGLCGLFYVEGALVASLLIGVAALSVGKLYKRYFDYLDQTAPIPYVPLPRIGVKDEKEQD